MLIDGKHWYGYEIHFKSGKILSDIMNESMPPTPTFILRSCNKKDIYEINRGCIEFNIITLFGDCTSWDDPEVQEWLKKHAQKIMREEL